MLKGYHLSVEGIRKGYRSFSGKMVCKRVTGWISRRSSPLENFRNFKMQRQRRERERELAKQQFCKCIMLFCTFHCRHCTTTAGKCLIPRFKENVNKRRLNFRFLSELDWSVLTWRHGGHIGVPKQWNGGHVGVPRQSCGSWILFLGKGFLLFQ